MFPLPHVTVSSALGSAVPPPSPAWPTCCGFSTLVWKSEKSSVSHGERESSLKPGYNLFPIKQTMVFLLFFFFQKEKKKSIII